MSDTIRQGVRPEVEEFIAAVRARFVDLSEEAREELLGGLEADVSELVAEQGTAALGDPAAYADELRSAAGLPDGERPRRRFRPGNVLGEAEGLQIIRNHWEELVEHPRVAPVWVILTALQPAWWALRAWVAAVIVARMVPGWEIWGLTWLPGVHPVLALLLLIASLAISTLVGLGRLWPGTCEGGQRTPGARTALVGLNVLAVLLLPVATSTLSDAQGSRAREVMSYGGWVRDPGVLNAGNRVCNIAAYDAVGQPLTGVQLFDQAGRPLNLSCEGQQNRKVPWVLGDVTRWNVFPLGERERPARTPERRADLEGARFPVPDRATTPAVTHPLLPPVPAPAPEVEEEDGQQSDRQERDKAGRGTQRDGTTDPQGG